MRFNHRIACLRRAGLRLAKAGYICTLCPHAASGAYVSFIRLICLVIAGALSLALLWAVLASAREGPGMGEVSVILHGGFMVVGAGLAVFLALICVMIAFWHHRTLRSGLLIITGGTVALIALWFGYSAVTSHLRDRAFDQPRAEQAEQDAAREAALKPIALRYYQELISGGLTAEQIAALRPAFEQEVAAFAFAQTQPANATTYFLSAHDIYMRLFQKGDGRLAAQLGYYNASACLHIESDLTRRMSAAQQADFGEMCPDWLMDYVR